MPWKYEPIRAIGLTIAGAVMLASPAHAADAVTSKIVNDTLLAEIKDFIANPVVELSVTSQNKRFGSMASDQIDALDKQWRAERKSEDQPLVAAILSSPLSSYLTQIQAKSGGLFTEIFVMDANGLNVGQSAITSDFWQGDEAKFQKTYPLGADAVFVDEAELHEGTSTYRAQVNLTLTDQARAPIGAITVEVNLTEFARRQAGK